MNNKRIVWGVGLLSGAILILVGIWLLIDTVNNQPPAAPAEAQVEITNDGFTPAELTIEPGTRVVWTNNTDTPHRVAAAPYPDRTQLPDLDSNTIAPGESYVFTFQNKGTFQYADYTKPTITGTIQVK